MIYSEVSGTLIKILVSKNQIIEEDTDLLVIECMKMHIPITANKRGKIIDIFIKKLGNSNYRISGSMEYNFLH